MYYAVVFFKLCKHICKYSFITHWNQIMYPIYLTSKTFQNFKLVTDLM